MSRQRATTSPPGGGRRLSQAAATALEMSKYSNKVLGIFCSAAGGPHQSINRAIYAGAPAVSFYIKNRRRWESPPLEQSQIYEWFETVERRGISLNHVVPHGTYFLNPGSPENENRKFSRDCMLDDCQRCEILGIKLYVFHPGSTLGLCSVNRCIATVARTINYVIERTNSVILLIENMAGSGDTVGKTFDEIRGIIDRVHNKRRVGVCLDTCHLFAMGYDFRTPENYEAIMREFRRKIGFRYLKAIHLNDSKRELNSRVDRHAPVGRGEIGIDAFANFMNDPRLDGIPMILETPMANGFATQLIDLYSLETGAVHRLRRRRSRPLRHTRRTRSRLSGRRRRTRSRRTRSVRSSARRRGRNS